MMKKRIMAIVLCAVMAIGSKVSVQANSSASQQQVRVMVNGTEVAFPDAKPFIDANGRTQVPVRFVTEALKGTVDWNNSTRAVTVKRGQITATLTIGSKEIRVMNVPRTMDTAPVIVQERTFVPLRFISEAFGAEVRWSAAEFTAYINDAYITDEEPSDVYKVGDFLIKIEDGDMVSVTADNTLNVRKNSGLQMLEESTELYRAAFMLQILTAGDLLKQRVQVETALRQNLSDGLVNEIMSYTSAVQSQFDILPHKIFEEADYMIRVIGGGGAITYRIYMLD